MNKADAYIYLYSILMIQLSKELQVVFTIWGTAQYQIAGLCKIDNGYISTEIQDLLHAVDTESGYDTELVKTILLKQMNAPYP